MGLDIDPARIEHNLSEGRRVIYENMQDVELWENLDLTDISSIILAAGTQESNVYATKYLRDNQYLGPIYALTMQEEEHNELVRAGASAVCLPITQAGEKLAELSLSDDDSPGYIVMETA